MQALGLVGTLISSNASSKAANAQIQGERERIALQRELQQQNREDLAPFRQLGVSALNPLGAYAGLNKSISPSDMLTNDPGYQFRFGQGLKGLESQLNARGLTNSGVEKKALMDYGQGVASNEYNNVFNRLMSIANIGSGATSQGIGVNQNYGAQAGDAMSGSANARASGYVGAANALGSGLSSYYNREFQKSMLDRLTNDGNKFPNPSDFYNTSNNYSYNYG